MVGTRFRTLAAALLAVASLAACAGAPPRPEVRLVDQVRVVKEQVPVPVRAPALPELVAPIARPPGPLTAAPGTPGAICLAQPGANTLKAYVQLLESRVDACAAYLRGPDKPP